MRKSAAPRRALFAERDQLFEGRQVLLRQEELPPVGAERPGRSPSPRPRAASRRRRRTGPSAGRSARRARRPACRRTLPSGEWPAGSRQRARRPSGRQRLADLGFEADRDVEPVFRLRARPDRRRARAASSFVVTRRVGFHPPQNNILRCRPITAASGYSRTDYRPRGYDAGRAPAPPASCTSPPRSARRTTRFRDNRSPRTLRSR